MAAPEFLVCLECETPCYDFVWRDDKVKEAMCQACGNEAIDMFMSEEELEELAGA